MQSVSKRTPNDKNVRMGIGNYVSRRAYFRYIRGVSHLSHHTILQPVNIHRAIPEMRSKCTF